MAPAPAAPAAAGGDDDEEGPPMERDPNALIFYVLPPSLLDWRDFGAPLVVVPM